MTAYLERARRALRTASIILADGDTIGASSRVYYALFDAVRAVLSELDVADVSRIRTHQGINHVFNATIVNTGLMDPNIARALPRAQELRSDADYGSSPEVDPRAVRAAIEKAAVFIDACAELIEARAGNEK